MRKGERANRAASCHRCRLESTQAGVMRHKCFGYNIHESERISGIYKYWATKRLDKKGFTLTGKQMIQLFDEADIRPEDIGRKAHEYHLARYGDTGPYEMGNCRFITARENLMEVNRPYATKSQETKDKIRESLMGHKRSQESVEKQKRNQQPWTDERRARQAEVARRSAKKRKENNLAKKGIMA